MSAENISIIASDFQTQLSSAISVAGTSFTIQSVTDEDGVTLSNGTYCFTIDRDNSKKEYFVGTLNNATKTVSSISSVSRQGALTANAVRSHRIGANVIISDHSILSSMSKIFRGAGTINPSAPLAYDTDPTLSSSTQLATKGYVDSVVTGGTVNTDRIILGSQTAGETVAAGNIIYFKSSDSRWWLADADLSATFSNVQLAVALGAGTAGNPISGGVQIYGKCDSFTGLTATATYYLSNTAGAVSSSAGTNQIIIGQAFSTTGIFLDPKIGTTLTGTIQMFGSSSAPTGFLNCDGSAISRTTYSGLFSVLSTSYGVGDGSTTFNIPDLRSAFPLGVGQRVSAFNFATTDVTVATDLFTLPATAYLQTGAAVVLTTTGVVPTLQDLTVRAFSIDASGYLSGDIMNGVVGNGQRIYLDSQSSTNLTAGNYYYVIDYSAGVSFRVSSTKGGAAAGTGNSGSGTAHSVGLAAGGTYYIIRVSSTTVKLATTYAEAVAGTVISLATVGSGTHTFTQTLTSRTLGESGGEENHILTIAEMPAHTHAARVSPDSGGGGGSSSSPQEGQTGSTGGGLTHNNMSPFTVVNFIIKT